MGENDPYKGTILAAIPRCHVMSNRPQNVCPKRIQTGYVSQNYMLVNKQSTVNYRVEVKPYTLR